MEHQVRDIKTEVDDTQKKKQPLLSSGFYTYIHTCIHRYAHTSALTNTDTHSAVLSSCKSAQIDARYQLVAQKKPLPNNFPNSVTSMEKTFMNTQAKPQPATHPVLLIQIAS